MLQKWRRLSFFLILGFKNKENHTGHISYTTTSLPTRQWKKYIILTRKRKFMIETNVKLFDV